MMEPFDSIPEVNRRGHPHLTKEWFAAGNEIWSDHDVIGYTRKDEDARYISALHNIYVALANTAIVLRAEVQDLQRALRLRGKK